MVRGACDLRARGRLSTILCHLLYACGAPCRPFPKRGWASQRQPSTAIHTAIANAVAPALLLIVAAANAAASATTTATTAITTAASTTATAAVSQSGTACRATNNTHFGP